MDFDLQNLRDRATSTFRRARGYFGRDLDVAKERGRTMIPLFIAARIYKIAATFAVLLTAFVSLKVHDHTIRSRVKSDIKQVTNDATHKILSAANRSLDPSVRGKRDPTTRDD